MPPNDDVANAIRLQPGLNGTYSNFCASVESKEPHPYTAGCNTDDAWCPGSTLKNTVWFTFLGPASGKVTLDTYGFNDHIAVYATDDYGNILSGNATLYQIIAANDDRSSTDFNALIENLSVDPFKTYWLQVDGYKGATGNLIINLVSNSLEVFPNPSNGHFDIIIADANDGSAELKVFSPVGRLLYINRVDVTNEANRFSMDLSSFTAGMYFLEARINGNTSKAKLIIVK
jgi:hypothetical protein